MSATAFSRVSDLRKVAEVADRGTSEMMGKAIISSAVGTAIMFLPQTCFAADLDLLTRLLIPGYIAQNFASACALAESNFLVGPIGDFDSVATYTEHLKKEITFKLSDEEALKVQMAAANVARNVARAEFRKHTIARPTNADVPLRTWCNTIVKHFILDLVATHIKRHRKFDLLINIATSK